MCCLVLPEVWAQKQKPQNQPYADMKWYHLGFHIGLHTQDLILTHTGAVTPDGETWFAEIPTYSPGFTVGVLGDLYMNPYFSLRLSPTVHFGDKQFTFIEHNTKEEFITSVRSNYLIVPLDIKYAAVRLNNYRPYLIGGVYTAFDIGRKRGNPILLKGNDYGVELGIGCDVYLPFFKLCPEIKFCFGLADMLEKDRSDLLNEADRKYSQAFSGASSRMIVFTFNFE
ncbi:MAG: PorT family protein [Tannerella sp.]|jgi:hypothetical protein|nr:PorT family protein [Tannerella sp.]